jgi:hypothetical protein
MTHGSEGRDRPMAVLPEDAADDPVKTIGAMRELVGGL